MLTKPIAELIFVCSKSPCFNAIKCLESSSVILMDSSSLKDSRICSVNQISSQTSLCASPIFGEKLRGSLLKVDKRVHIDLPVPLPVPTPPPIFPYFPQEPTPLNRPQPPPPPVFRDTNRNSHPFAKPNPVKTNLQFLPEILMNSPPNILG